MASVAQLHSTSDRYFAALAVAERRAMHSFFDQHIVEDRELGYFALDEGDTTLCRITWRASWFTPCTGRCSTSSDPKSEGRSRQRFLPISCARRGRGRGEKRSGAGDALGPAPPPTALLRARHSCRWAPRAFPAGAGSDWRGAGGTDNPRSLAPHAVLGRRLSGGAVVGQRYSRMSFD